MSDSVERFLERLRKVGGDAAVIKTFHPSGDERYCDEHIALPVSWFEDTEKRLGICCARVERHLKPPFPPAVEKLDARLGFMEKLVGLCVGAICALWLTLLFLLLRH